MRRISLTAALAAAAVLAAAGTASADVGDIDNLSLDQQLTGTAEIVEVSGNIRCTTTIPYGLVAGVAQTNEDTGDEFNTFQGDPETGATGPDAAREAVGAFGPNQGNEANSPCSTTRQSYEVALQRNRDSGTFQTGTLDAFVIAGTSAEDGSRGPGPFIGDLVVTSGEVAFQRTDP